MYKMLFKLVDFTCGETVNQGAGARFLQPVLQALPPLEEKPHRLCVSAGAQSLSYTAAQTASTCGEECWDNTRRTELENPLADFAV